MEYYKPKPKLLNLTLKVYLNKILICSLKRNKGGFVGINYSKGVNKILFKHLYFKILIKMIL